MGNALKCSKCNEPAACSISVDPFGKSDATEHFCILHAPPDLLYAAQRTIRELEAERDALRDELTDWHDEFCGCKEGFTDHASWGQRMPLPPAPEAT